MRSIRFLLSSSPQNLSAALEGKPSATVEAEYGDVTVTGSIFTMAHHGKNAGQPAPCSYNNEVGEGVEVVGLSHFDLDTLGGAAALLGVKPEMPGFWALAEFVDLNGPHRLEEGMDSVGASQSAALKIHAFWAWSESFRVFAPRDGSVVDVTDKVIEGVRILERLYEGDEELLALGTAFREAKAKLNTESLVRVDGSVAVRVADAFVNGLYTTPDGVVCAAVVGFNPRIGSITVSFADGAVSNRHNARDIVQSLWGTLAGGHNGIAGSPRDRVMTYDDLEAAVRATVAAL